MLRTALQPKWLGLLGVVILVIVAFIQLGRWQLGVAQDKALAGQLAQAQAQQVVALDTVLQPHEPFPGELSTRPVTATGEYAADEQVLITDRRLDGVAGFWVVTGLRTEQGPTLPVLRGFVTDPAQATAPPAGVLTVRGALAPPESPLRDSPTPEGWLRSVDLARLVNTWSGDLYNAFVFLEKEEPGDASAGGPGAAVADPATLNTLTPVPTPLGDIGWNWRNAAYAAQWWIFAVFAFWMWWRMVRDEHRKSLPVEPDPKGEPGD